MARVCTVRVSALFLLLSQLSFVCAFAIFFARYSIVRRIIVNIVVFLCMIALLCCDLLTTTNIQLLRSFVSSRGNTLRRTGKRPTKSSPMTRPSSRTTDRRDHRRAPQRWKGTDSSCRRFRRTRQCESQLTDCTSEGTTERERK